MKSVDSSELTIPQSDILSCGSFIGGVPDLLILAARLRPERSFCYSLPLNSSDHLSRDSFLFTSSTGTADWGLLPLGQGGSRFIRKANRKLLTSYEEKHESNRR
jgi:hypothetical protein